MKALQPNPPTSASKGGERLLRLRGRPRGDVVSIAFSVGAWATALGRDARTLKTKLHKAGVRTEPGQPITAMEIQKALLDEERQLKNRNLLADAQGKELDLKVKRGNVITTEVARAEVARTFGAMRNAILFIRAALPSRANPQSPATAKKAWDQLEAQYWPWMRGAIEGSSNPFPDPWASPTGQTVSEQPTEDQ